MTVHKSYKIVFSAVLTLSLLLSGCGNSFDSSKISSDVNWNSKYADSVKNNATGIALYGNTLYICQNTEKAFIKIDLLSGMVSDMPSEYLKSPHGLRYCNGFLWITDIETQQIYKLNLDGDVIAEYGQRDVAGDDKLHFNKPTDIAVADNGDIYIADGYGNSRVVCLDKDGKYLFEWGKEGNGEGEFKYPHNIIIHDDLVYVADRANKRIQVFDLKGNYVREFDHFGKVFGLYCCKNNLYISCTTPERHSIIISDFDGDILAQYGQLGDGWGQFTTPHALVVEGSAVYVAEVGNKRVQKINLD
ncbi:MAG: 6-bladed beta-propeller [Sedimentisphaeraceae bacterium JB056]